MGSDPSTPAHRGRSASWAVRASSAVYGFAFGISLAPRLELRARPEELLSALKLAGYSPRGVMLQFLVTILLTAIFSIIGARLAGVLAGYRWAEVSYCAAALLAPIALMYWGNVRHVLLLGLVAAAVVLLRRRDPHFTRADVVLLPAFLSCYIAFVDVGFGKTAVAMLLRAAIAIFALRLILRTSEAMVAAPLALIAQAGWLPARPSAFIALIVIFAAPALLAWTRVRLPAKVIYPIIVFVYPLTVLKLTPPFTINFFEDSHSIPVAAEMMRGEKPYTNIIPTHGIITDGLLDLIGLEAGGGSLHSVLQTRLIAGALSSVAIDCLVVAATGSAELGLLASFLAFSLAPGSTLWFRPAAAMFALAATVAATRLRSRRWFMAAGALVVVAWLSSIDFGLYSAIVALFAAFRARALRSLAIGIVAALVPTLLIFAAFGFALDFVRVSLLEILGSHSVYFVRPLEIPPPLRSPAVLHQVLDPDFVILVTWVIALIASCAALSRSPLRARRGDAPWLIGVWMVVAAASFVERGNYHFNPVVTPFIVVALWALSRNARTVAVVLAVMVVMLAQPFRHVVEWIPGLRKAEAAPLFDPATSTAIADARRFTATLGPGQTFVDFTNSALLYALLDRDCPLRQVEVANYQSVDAQRDVVRTIERNPHIRAALVNFPPSNQNVDGIPNSERAPLVWKYLQDHFTPAFDRDGVVFWVRR